MKLLKNKIFFSFKLLEECLSSKVDRIDSIIIKRNSKEKNLSIYFVNDDG